MEGEELSTSRIIGASGIHDGTIDDELKTHEGDASLTDIELPKTHESPTLDSHKQKLKSVMTAFEALTLRKANG